MVGVSENLDEVFIGFSTLKSLGGKIGGDLNARRFHNMGQYVVVARRNVLLAKEAVVEQVR